MKKMITSALGGAVALYTIAILMGANVPGARLASGKLFVGNASNVAAPVDLSGDVTISNTGAVTIANNSVDGTDIAIGADAAGDIMYYDGTDYTRLAKGAAGTELTMNAADTAPQWTQPTGAVNSRAVSIDFTKEPWVPIFAKTTLAVWTEADTQQDFMWVGGKHYFEFFQDGANFVNANLWVPASTGWALPGDAAADMGWQLTEGIILGSAHSFTAGTSAAFRIRAAFYLPDIAEFTELHAGFRQLGAYVVADDATEIATAYDNKVIAGIVGVAGDTYQRTSLATVDAATDCTAADVVNGNILGVEVNVSAAGLTSVKFAAASPAGTTAAQMQAGVTAVYAALAADAACNAAAVTLTAGEYVPTIMAASAAGSGASTATLVNYYVGLQ